MKNILILFVIIFCFASCHKDDDNDYRNKFIGNYKCNKTGVFQCYNNTANFDTIVIVSVKKAGDSSIYILDATLKINTLGEFGGGLYPDSAYHGFGGFFSNDSIFFNTYQVGLGCFTSLDYKGEKQ